MALSGWMANAGAWLSSAGSLTACKIIDLLRWGYMGPTDRAIGLARTEIVPRSIQWGSVSWGQVHVLLHFIKCDSKKCHRARNGM